MHDYLTVVEWHTSTCTHILQSRRTLLAVTRKPHFASHKHVFEKKKLGRFAEMGTAKKAFLGPWKLKHVV